MNYAQIQYALNYETDICPVEQWHGLLCGLLCAGRPVTVELLHRLLSEITDMKNDLLEPQQEMLGQLAQFTHLQLDEAQADFDLLLPNDDEGLCQRTQALTAWCESFLFGLSAGGLDKHTELPTEISEFLADLVDISHAEHRSDTSSEEDEYNYTELVEYIRIGVMLVNEELNPVGSPQQAEH